MVSKCSLPINVQVPELVELDLPLPFVPQNENSFANTTSIAPSESFWSGQSEGEILTIFKCQC